MLATGELLLREPKSPPERTGHDPHKVALSVCRQGGPPCLGPSVTLTSGDVRSFNFPDGGGLNSSSMPKPTKPASRLPQAPFDIFDSICCRHRPPLEFAASHGTRRSCSPVRALCMDSQPSDILSDYPKLTPESEPLDPPARMPKENALPSLCALSTKRPRAWTRDGCWAFCGPHLPLHAHFAIGNFIGDVMAGRPIRIPGDGTPRRSFLYGSDLAIWLWTMLFKTSLQVPINVGLREEISILDRANSRCHFESPGSSRCGSAACWSLAPRYVHRCPARTNF